MAQKREPRNQPTTYGQLIPDKAPRTHNKEKKVSSKSGAGKTGHSHANESNWTPILYHSQKLTQNGLDLNLRPETTKAPRRTQRGKAP